jgi:hypothetical protein
MVVALMTETIAPNLVLPSMMSTLSPRYGDGASARCLPRPGRAMLAAQASLRPWTAFLLYAARNADVAEAMRNATLES